VVADENEMLHTRRQTREDVSFKTLGRLLNQQNARLQR
jgi:hypothetical protein